MRPWRPRPGERFVSLQAAAPDVPTVPDGDALAALMAGDAMIVLMRLTARLRRDCPWDREQTDADDRAAHAGGGLRGGRGRAAGDPEKLLDELGDLLFQTTSWRCCCRNRARATGRPRRVRSRPS
jgi:hypothetical protein